ncbi:hypothetical protein [Noviherbaspirillum saxi]|uniref:Lipoprotein n=1 Tax=Noviherbaspirillum saxi TaxID=2320863 RepID=A0A3A3FK23_9BURK|nr:hypothetical protein [Noviherbaspirillum saxi]RJF95853.1 hypothetical protein D3871_21025 [Noviherbaspirillum saxi]
MLLFAVSIFSAGCSMMAPQYTASLDNVQNLRDAGAYAAKVGVFESNADKDNANPISLRGSSLASPYQNSYGNYVAEAIKQELSLAEKLSPNSGVEISGAVLKNDINIPAAGMGTASIEARFIVKTGGVLRYEQIKSVRHEFPSAFAGAVAIPRAAQEYPIAVQKLLGLLYSDRAFINSIK